MTKVYVAGPISDNDPIKIFKNEKNGIDTAAWLILRGFSVFCPHIDFLYLLGNHGKQISKAMLQRNSMAFVADCDCMLVLPGWEDSPGTRQEMAQAEKLNIPIYFDAKILAEAEG